MRRDWLGTCCVPGCTKDLPRSSEIPTCYSCGYAIAKTFDLRLDAERRERQMRETSLRVARGKVARGDMDEPTVYYVLIGDYIKIGYAANLRTRFRALRADKLLAVEPGGREVEAARHRQFAAERIHARRENFRPSSRLDSHIEGLVKLHSLPRWSTVPDANVIHRSRQDV